MPDQERRAIHCPLEPLGVRRVEVEKQRDDLILIARKFPDLEFACVSGSPPIDVPRALIGDVGTNSLEIGSAPTLVTLQLSRYPGQE
jgi:hypothetical protein